MVANGEKIAPNIQIQLLDNTINVKGCWFKEPLTHSG